MNNDWKTIDLLRHVRHDWLNKIQLIKGNLALNKMERAKEYIDEIVMEAQQESKLTNLNIPQFASMLLTYNWENHSFRLEFEVLNDAKCENINEQELTGWTSLFFSHLNAAVKLYHDNHMFVSIDPQIEGIRFFFDFSGIIEEKDKIDHFLKSDQFTSINVNVQEFSQEELVLEIFLPAKTINL